MSERPSIKLGQGESREALRGSHSAYVEPDGTLVIDWYHHGPDVAYEFAHMARLAPAEKARFAGAIGCPVDVGDLELLATIDRRFPSYFEIVASLQEQGIAFTVERDMRP